MFSLYGYSRNHLQLFWNKCMLSSANVSDVVENGKNMNSFKLGSHFNIALNQLTDSNDLSQQQSLYSQSQIMQSYSSGLDSFELNICCNSRSLTNKLNLIISLMMFASIACIVLFFVSNYVKQALVALEQSHSVLTVLCFLILFIFVSLPMAWGYVLLNLAAGYLYGVIYGMAIVFFCALVGITVSHFLLNHSSLKRCILTQISGNTSFRTIMSIVESRHGFKVIVLARLTPIPFGLQNALFSLCKMNLWRYLSASMIGMLPTQGLHTYIGSTLRSMQDVVSTDHDNKFAQIIFGTQFLLVGALLIFVLKKAKTEFNKTLHEAESLTLQVTCV